METSALSFAHPAVLNGLWLLPLLAGLYWWAERRRHAMIGRIVAPKLRAMLAGNASPVRRWFRGGCVLAATGLLVVTLAGPRLGYDTLEVPHRGRDVIIAMDVSRSMLAPDVAPSRLERAKLLAEDLISELGADRVGLVAFAGSAFLQAPLTLDHGAVLTALDELDTGVIPKGGTNIAAAIRTAMEAFGKAEGFSRAVVIISDGEELDADGLAAAKQAAAEGIRIFTVGVGSPEGSEIPLGQGEFVRDTAGKVVQSRLDAERMAQIAEVAGGFYVPLDDNAAQRLVAEGIGRLAEADITTNASRRPIERYQWPLAAAIALLMLQAMVGERRRRIPVAAAVAAGALWCTPGWAAPGGIAAYERGDYEQAKQIFEKRLKIESDLPVLQRDVQALQLNAGAAAYRLKDYAKASEYFSRATLAEDPKLRSDAEFNLGNTLFRQGEGQQDKEKTKADWKDAIAKYDAALKTRPDHKEAKENKEKVEQLLKELEKKQEQEKQQQQQQKDEKKQDQQQKQERQQELNRQRDQQQQQQQGGQQDKQQEKDQQKQDQQSAEGGNDKEEQKDKSQQDQQQQQGGGEKEEEQNDQGQGKQDQGQQPDEQKEGDQPGKKEGEEQQPGGGAGDKTGEGETGEEKEPQGEGGEPSDRQQPGRPGEKPAPVPEQSGEKKQGEVRGAQPEEGGEQEQQQAAVAEAAEEDGKMSEPQARALLRSLEAEEERVELRERRNFQDVLRDW